MSSEFASWFPNSLLDASQTAELVHSDRLSNDQAGLGRPENALFDLRSTATVVEASDEALLERVGHHEREALAILFRRYARLVRSVAFRILRNESEADDLLQEVFLYIFRKAGQFDGTKGWARSWIVQVTYHRAIDRRRHLASRHFYDALALDTPDAAQLGREVAFYEQSLEGRLGKTVLALIEDSLSLDQRETLRLYFFEGCTLEEIAQTMGQSPGNVRNHHYRALEKIRKLLFARKLSAE
jgi:RNA polymerase sigma-70 factor (ECF subfamily)